MSIWQLLKKTLMRQKKEIRTSI